MAVKNHSVASLDQNGLLFIDNLAIFSAIKNYPLNIKITRKTQTYLATDPISLL